MKKILVPFADTHQFSTLIDDYLSGDAALKPFYRLAPEISSFKEAIKQRKEFPCDRKILCDRLNSQYSRIFDSGSPFTEKVKSSIQLLEKQNCYTVTTGHQLNIFTGPLYSIYKIATTVKLAQELNGHYPENHFVPIFWMASDDHDFEEINYASIFGKQVKWDRKAGGAVGRLDLEGIKPVIEEVRAIIGSDAGCLEIFESAYLSSSTLAGATRKIIHALFGEYGLVVIDGDDAMLKKLFVNEMRDDILLHKSFDAVTKSSQLLSEIHKTQVQPRQINLFYLGEGTRERIVKNEDNNYSVLNTDIIFDREGILRELESHPRNFSPNVVLRPMYQEKILPNLAYIGGPGELTYWLQFMGAFDANGIPFPVLMLRNCMLIADKSSLGKAAKLGLSVPELFNSTDYLILKVLENSSEIHVGTEDISSLIQKAFQELGESWTLLDPSLVSGIEAEKQKALNGIAGLEEKARRAMKRKNETVVNQVKNLKEKLFPNGGLQERTENLLPFFCRMNAGFIHEIVLQTNPFERKFIVLEET